MKNIVKPVIVLTLIAFICTAALAGVNKLTADRIAKAQAEKKAATMKMLFPEEKSFTELTVDEGELSKYGAAAVYETDSKNGYIVELSTSGYGGEIKMMLAFSPKCEILGVKVLEHEETSGIGTRVVEDQKYLSQYVEKDANKGGEIDAVAGATISSKAVLNAVNNASNLMLSVVKK